MLIIDSLPNEWNIVVTQVIPSIFISLSIISCFVILLTFHLYERLRIYTGKLIILINIVSLPFNILVLASLYYPGRTKPKHAIPTDEEVGGNETWCQIIGVVFNFVILSLFLLNSFLIHNLIRTVIDRENTFPRRFRRYLLLTGIISTISCVVVGITKNAGRGPMGICWMKSERMIEWVHEIFFLAVVIFLLWGLIFVMRREKGRLSHYESKYEQDMALNLRANFIKFNLAYIGVFIASWAPTGLMAFIDFIMSQKEMMMNGPYWAFLKCLSLYCVCLYSFGNLMVRLQEPFIKSSIKRTFNIKFRASETSNFSEGNEIFLSGKENLNRNSTWGEWEASVLHSMKNNSLQDLGENKLVKKVSDKKDNNNSKQTEGKENMGVSLQINNIGDDFENENDFKREVLSCLISVKFCLEVNKPHKISIPEKNPPWEAHYYRDLLMKNKGIEEFTDSILKIYTLNVDSNKICEVDAIKRRAALNCINFAPVVFSHIQRAYSISDSSISCWLEPEKTITGLKQQSNDDKKMKQDWEKIASHNKKIILKKIQKAEKKYLIDKFLQNYHSHIAKHNFESFITPLLGLYSFQMTQTQNISILMWKNKHIERSSGTLCSTLTFSNVDVRRTLFNESDGTVASEETFLISDLPNEPGLVLKDKEKIKLLDILGRDISFLIKNEAEKYTVILFFFKMKNTTNKQKRNFNKAVSMPITKKEQKSADNNHNTGKNNNSDHGEEEEEEKIPDKIVANRQSEDIHRSIDVSNTDKDFICLKTMTLDLYCTVEISNIEYSKNIELQNQKKSSSSCDKKTIFSILNPDAYAKTFMQCLERIL